MQLTNEHVSERIRKFNAPLLQDKVALKYKLMADSAYRFYRGTCHIFYEDLSKAATFPSSPNVWACGDLHLENFGSYKADNRLVYFDQNDFDEALLAPAAWEVVRMVCSIFIAFKSFKIEDAHALEWANLFLKTYSATLASGKAKHVEERLAEGIVRSFLEKVGNRKSRDLLKKYVDASKKKCICFVSDKQRCIKVSPELKGQLVEHIFHWINRDCKKLSHFDVLDVAYRVAGTGSLGVKRYVFLLKNTRKKRSYLLLDMKESRPSALLPFLNIEQPHWPTEAEREIAIQSRSQYATVALLGTTVFLENSFVIQEMQPADDRINFSQVVVHDKQVSNVIEVMALLAASAHLRTSGRQGSAIADELIVFGKNQQWQQQLVEYARNYAGQVQHDYETFFRDYSSGYFRLP